VERFRPHRRGEGQYSNFLGRFALMPHLTFPVSYDEIVGSAPVPPRRSLPRFGWGVAHKRAPAPP
jgi:hypothetical protein